MNQESENPDFSCMCCAGHRCAPHTLAAPDYFLPTGFHVNYVRCLACGLVQQYPLPGSVDAFYEGYPVHAKKSRLHEVMRRVVMRPVYFPLTSLAPNELLLDYGAGDGWFLASAKPTGVQRAGFELNPAHARSLAATLDVPVYSDAGQMARDLRGRVDVITLHFVLEHLTDLSGTLGKLSELLKPTGRIYAVVPNLANLEFQCFGKRWHGFDAPRHISFPTGEQLEPILKRVGLRVERESFVPFPNTLAASLCIALTGRFRPLPFIAFLPLACVWSRLYPRGTRAITLVNS